MDVGDETGLLRADRPDNGEGVRLAPVGVPPHRYAAHRIVSGVDWDHGGRVFGPLHLPRATDCEFERE